MKKFILLVIAASTMGLSAMQKSLYDAAFHGDVEKVNLLLKQGANVNQINKDSDFTVLMIACDQHRLPVIKVLVEAGALINIVNRDNDRTALDYACAPYMPPHSNEETRKEVIDFLKSRGALNVRYKVRT